VSPLSILDVSWYDTDLVTCHRCRKVFSTPIDASYHRRLCRDYRLVFPNGSYEKHERGELVLLQAGRPGALGNWQVKVRGSAHIVVDVDTPEAGTWRSSFVASPADLALALSCSIKRGRQIWRPCFQEGVGWSWLEVPRPTSP
jgi:hypothetical protein